MKKIVNFISFIALCLMVTGCGTDNYDAPTSILQGQILYNGNPIGLRGSSSIVNNEIIPAIELQLYQDGYELHNSIRVTVDQEGKFRSKLFDGQYKMVTKDKNGPWVNSRDTIIVNVKGNTIQNVPVTPFFIVNNDAITMSADSLVTFTGTIEKIDPTAVLGSVTLYIGDTQFTDNLYNVANVVVANSKITTYPYTLSETMNLKGDKKVLASKHLYGRICVKTTGTTEGIFSKVFKLK